MSEIPLIVNLYKAIPFPEDEKESAFFVAGINEAHKYISKHLTPQERSCETCDWQKCALKETHQEVELCSKFKPQKKDIIKLESIKIGSQIWTTRNIDIDIPGSFAPGGDDSNIVKYGRLYTWESAMKIPEIVGDGWRLPTNADWDKLIKYAGKDNRLKLKSKDWNGTDEYGFNALPAGLRYSNGSFYYLGSFAFFWTATEYDASVAWYRHMYPDYDDVYRYNSNKDNGCSVRLVKNA